MKHFYFKSIFLSLLMMVMGVGNGFAEDRFEKYSGEITEGDYLLVSGETAMNTTVSSNRLQFQAVKIENGVITQMNNGSKDFSTVVWTISKSGDYYTLYNATEGKYAASTGSKNQAQLLESGTDDKSLWTITGTSTYEFVNKKNASNGVNKNLRKNPGYGFACYSTSTGEALTLYKKVVDEDSPLSSIAVTGVTPIPTFYVGDAFVFGGTVTATYENGNTNNVTNLASFSGYDMSTAGTQTVTVSYTEGETTKTETYQITVKNRTLQSIAVDAPTTSFNVGDDFSFGGAVTATYDDGTTKDVTSDATFSGYNMSTEGDQTVTVSYTEGEGTKTATYDITVSAVAAQFVTVDPSEVTIVKGSTYQLRATVIPDEATDKTVTWSSDDTSVATVSSDGVVTAVAAGDAVITAKANGGAEDAKSQCAVTVVDEIVETTATGNLNNSDTGVFAGEETLSGSGNANKGKTANGKLATNVGNVNVVYTVGTTNGNAYLDSDHIRMYSEGTTLKFTAPEGYELTKIVLTKTSGNFTSLKTDVETYSNGTWTGASESVTFTGQTATIRLSAAEVTLEKIVETGELLSIAVDNPKTEFSVGDTFEFGGTVTAAYDNGATKDVTNDATFSGYDMDTAGEQTVTVSYTEGETTETTTYDITVSEVAVTGITLDQEEATILVGVTKTLTATIEPENATDKTVIWTSSDEDVATVDENGVVTAVAAGTATITATSNENDEITASCAVTVVAEIDETTATGNLNNSDSGVFAGVTGFTQGAHSVSGTLATDVGNVTVAYAGTTTSYLNQNEIRMYNSNATLKLTAPTGYEFSEIEFTGTDNGNLIADAGTYENKKWTGAERSVTFTSTASGKNLKTVTVTLVKAAPKPPLASIAVDGATTDFIVNSEFVFNGTVTATYEDQTTKDVTAKATFSNPDMTTAGTQEVTVSYTEDEVTKTATYSITVREPETITFRKITSTDELEAGKRYVLVNEEAQKVIAEYYNYHFNVNDATISDDRVTLLETEANILTLGGEEGAWTFATSIEADKYLALTSAGNNLESKDDGETAQWTISFDEAGNAVIQSNYITSEERVIRYNSSQPRFACYKGTQKPVQLYVESDLEDVTLTIKSVGYATLYYSDRALKVPDGVTAKTYKVVGGKLAESKTYAPGSKIPKGEAVVLKGAAGEYTFLVSSTPEPKDADNMLNGSDEAEMTTGGNYYYALQAKSKDGKHGPGFYWMNSTGAAFENGAHKAYMALDEKFAEAQSVGGAKSFYLFVEATTGISGIDAASADRTEMYNLNGQRVDRGYKGVVIKNGKKIVIK